MPVENVRLHATQKKKDFAKQLRSDMPNCEQILWKHIKRSQAGAKFTRQRVLFGWIADFYCGILSLAIELDGSTHDEEKDRYRDKILSQRGIKTIRYTNSQIYNDLEFVVSDIKRIVIARIKEKRPLGPISGNGPWSRLLALQSDRRNS